MWHRMYKEQCGSWHAWCGMYLGPSVDRRSERLRTVLWILKDVGLSLPKSTLQAGA